jgi:hypothetical protein
MEQFTTLIIHSIFTYQIRKQDLSPLIQFIFRDIERIDEFLIRTDIELYQLEKKMSEITQLYNQPIS